MKQFFGLYDKQEELKIKDAMISFSGINNKYINFFEIYTGPTDYIHVIYIDDPTFKNKKDLVLFSGWAGSAILFFKTFKKLSEHFRIIGIDFPGMGLSSRSDFDCKTLSETEDYFLETMKLCLDKMDITRFSLLGHSFGGYIAGLFSVRYIEMIEKLILVSPIGLSHSYVEITSTRLEDLMQSLFFKVEQTGPSMFKFFGMAGGYIFDKICTKEKFRGLTNDEEFVTYKKLLYNFLKNKDGSDKCIFILFDKNLQANKPLNIYHDELKDVDILILYGDRDWCPAKHGEEFKNMFSQNNVTIDYVKDSGHLIQTDNYDELSEKIIKYLTCLKSEYDIFYEKSENKENITTNVNSEDAVDELLFDMV